MVQKDQAASVDSRGPDRVARHDSQWRKENINLDLLRSLAVGLVVLSHVPFFAGWTIIPMVSLKAVGHVGVAIFFVHTTLVLMMSLERHGPSAVPFFARRLLRIYPLSVAVVLLLAALKWLAGQPLDTHALLSNLFLVQNITGHPSTPDPLWTLPYEIQMYLLLPLLYAVLNSSRSKPWLVLIAAASLTLASADLSPAFTFLPCFLPGVLAFVLGRRREGHLHPAYLFLLVIFAAVVIPFLVTKGLNEIHLLWVFCALLGVVIPRCQQLVSIPLGRAAKTVATYSYGIYLTHVLALGLAFNGAGGTDVTAWVTLAILLPGFGFLAYHGIEKHGIALGVKLAGRTRKTRRSGSAVSA